ncbi:MAG: RagB/SusD family nutrient uptake outer membrane protein [Paludibacter sp.]|nr:RagB/SusD family nutrient uptake outer membrane protein [Paludibacter sp.]
MKTNIKILLLIISLGLFSSCEDFFYPGQTGLIKSDEFYKDLNNLRIGLNSVYNVVQSKDYQVSEVLFGEAMSDNSWNMQDVEIDEAGQLVNFQFNTDNPFILKRYQVNYTGINKANQVIRSAPYVKFRANGTSEKEIREVLGQAKLLRAMFYFNLVKTFGGVPIQPENINLGNMVVPRSSIEDVYAYIEKDLREAVLIMRRNRYQLTEAGQTGVGGALGMLMKVLVYQASPGIKLSGVDKEQKWAEALQIGNFFIKGVSLTYDEILKYNDRYEEPWDSLVTRLALPPTALPATSFFGQDVVSLHQLDDFDKIFRLNGEFSPESLIEINHHDFSVTGMSTDESWPVYGSVMNRYGGTASEIAITPTNDLSNAYYNDPRKLYTMTGRSINNYFKQEETDPAIGWFNYGDAMVFVKHYTFRSEGSPQNRNYRIMRYTEAILLYAEILNESGKTREAVDYVNFVRQRARKLLDPKNPNAQYNISANLFLDIPYAPYEIVRDAILLEKRIEMAAEFDRWYELARLGILPERMASIYKNAPVEQPSGKIRIRGKYFRKGVNELFPIPQREILLSNGVITQNYGY